MCSNIFWNVKPGWANIDGDIHSRVFNLIGILIVLQANHSSICSVFAIRIILHLNLYQLEYRGTHLQLFTHILTVYYTVHLRIVVHNASPFITTYMFLGLNA